MLHGDIRINHTYIGEWFASRKVKCPEPSMCYIYECKVIYTDKAGYREQRYFYVYHNPSKGPLTLTYIVTMGASVALEQPAYSKSVMWHDFCDMHGFDYDLISE